MSQDFPDFTRAVRLLGVDASGNLVTVLLDSAGNLQALLKGETAAAALKVIRVDDDGQLIIIPRGESGNYMSVDANGYLTAVLKGIFGGDLHTMAVDANGRLEAFILDNESQWGDILRVGNADLAARLGSPITWDWRGNLLYFTDFSEGYGPVISQTSGTGGAIALGPEYAGTGGFALKMTAGSTANHYARAQLSVGTNPCARIGVAVRFAISTNTQYVQLQLLRQQGANSPWAYGRIDVANSKLQVLDSTPSWQNVGDIQVNLSAFTYCWLKLVINQDTGYYERILYNDQEFDASAYEYDTLTSTIYGSVFAELQNTGRSGNNDVVYLDQIILTVNEPENI
jgi:hypothetical protein